MTLRLRPTRESPPRVVVADVDALAITEIDHRFFAANVYGRMKGWSLLRLRDGGYGWLAPEDAGPFTSYEDLLRHTPDWSVNEPWDRTLAERPGNSGTIRVPRDARRHVVGYLEGIGTPERIPNSRDAGALVRKRHGGNQRLVVKPDGTQFLEFDSGVIVPAFDRPSVSATRVAEVENHAAGYQLVTTGGHPSQPLVFSTKPGWSEVALKGEDAQSHRKLKRAWVEDDRASWRFHQVSREQADRIVSVHWGQEDGPAVTIKRMLRVRGALWLQVEVFYDSECDRQLEGLDGEPRTVVARGWIRAHDAAGNPRLWFVTCYD